MAISFTIRKDWMSGVSPMRNAPATIQAPTPTFIPRQTFQIPEEPKPKPASQATNAGNASATKPTTRAKPTQTAQQGLYKPSFMSDADYQASLKNANTSKYDRYNVDKSKYNQRLAATAQASTARTNRQTGLRFRTLLGGTDSPGVRASATATDRAWFDAMSDAEKARAAQIKSPVERGKYINSLDLNNRAATQLRQRRDETAKALEARASQIGPVRPTDSRAGRLIADYAQSGSKDVLEELGVLGMPLHKYDKREVERLTEPQRDVISKIAKSGDYQAVADYFDAIEYKLKEQNREILSEKNKALGYEHPVYSIIPEGAGNAIGGIPAILDGVYHKIRESLTGEWTPIDPNSHVYDMVAATQAIAEGAQERISEIQNPYGQGAARIARSGASSALTNGLQLMGGGALGLSGTALSNFTLAVMSTSAAGQTLHRELQGGGTDSEALTNAIASGVIEALTEKVSLDRFTSILPSLAYGTGTARQQAMNWLKEFAIQGGIEGLEEIAGNVLEQSWDILYEGENSEYSLRTQAILAQKIINNGGPEKYAPTPQDVQAAREQAFTGLFVEQSAEAFLSAVFSSLLLTGVPAASSRINVTRAGNNLKYKGWTDTEIIKAEMFPGTEASEIAKELRTQQEQGGESKVSGYKLGKMAILTNYEIQKTLGEMAESPDAEVRNFARYLINSDKIQTQNLTVNGLQLIFDILRNDYSAQETAQRREPDTAPPVPQTEPTPASALPVTPEATPEQTPATPEPVAEPEPTATDAPAETVSVPPPKLTMRNVAPTPIDGERGGAQFPSSNLYLDQAPALMSFEEYKRAYPEGAEERAREDYDALFGKTQETKAEKSANRGKSQVAPNQYVDFHWEVIPVDSLNISHDEYGNENPQYPKALQPRDRSRAASQRDISKIAHTLDPVSLSGKETVQSGAPLVNQSGAVISGNARSAAIRAAYNNQYESAENYENYIRNHAEDFGLDPAQIPERPVLVRVADNVADEIQLARDSNVAPTARLSPSEQAELDAEWIGDIIQFIYPSEGGGLNTPQNKDFRNIFVAALPSTEQSALLNERGELTGDALKRANNAILAYAYQNKRLTTRFADNGGEDMKNIVNALVEVAPKMSQLRTDAQNGDIYDIPVIDTILNGANLYETAKRRKASVAEIVNQANLNESWDANATLVAEVLERCNRSARGVRMFLNDLANAVYDFGSPDAPSLFGGSQNATIENALDTAAAKTNQREGANFQRGEGQFGGQGLPVGENPGVRTESESGQPDGEGVSPSPAEDVGADAVAPKAERDKADFQETKKRWNDAAQSPDTLAALGVTREVADAMAYFLNNTSIERIDDSPTYPEMDEPYLYWLHGAYDETLSSLLEAYNKTKDPYSGDQFALDPGNVYDPTETRKLAGTAHFGAPKLLDFEQYILKQGLLRQEQNAEPAKAQNESANPKTPQREAQTPNAEETEQQAPKEQLAEKRRDYSKWETDFTFYEIAKEELDRLPDADEKLDKLSGETRQFKTEVMDYFGTIADAPIGSVMIQAQSLAEYWRGFFKRALDSPNVFVNEANGSLDWSNQLTAGTRDSLVQGVFNGLTSSYPDLINASFTLDLDNVTIKSKEGARILFDYIRSGHFDDIRKHFMHGMSQTIIDSIDKMYSFESAYQEAKQATLDSLYGYVDELKDSQKSRYKKVLLNTRKGYSVTEAERIRNAIMDGAELSTQRTDSGLSYFMKTDGAKKPEKLSEIAYRFAQFTESQRESQAEAQSHQSQAMDAERNPTITASLPDANADANAEGAFPEGVGAASYAFYDSSRDAQLESLTAQYGHIKGEEGRRQLDRASEEKGVYIPEIPAQTNDETYVGRNVVTQLSAPGIAKERMSDYEERLLAEYFNRNPLTHKGELDKANDLWSRHGGSLQWAQKYLRDKVEKRQILETVDIALFQEALVKMSHTDMSPKEYIEFAAEFNGYASYLGHSLNLLKLLKKIDPNFQLTVAQHETDKINDKFIEEAFKRAKNKDAADNKKAQDVTDGAREDVLDDFQSPERAEQKRQDREKANRKRRKPKSQKARGESQKDGEIITVDGKDYFFPWSQDTITIKGENGQKGRTFFHVQHQNQHGFPVPYWMSDAGKIIANAIDNLTSSALEPAPQKPTERRVVATVMRDIMKFAEPYLPQSESPVSNARTADDRIRDFFANRQKYAEAWRSAQDTLRVKYEREGNTKKLDALNGFLDNELNIENVLNPRLNADIEASMREIGVQISAIIRENNPQKSAVGQQIADLLIQRYGVPDADAQRAGEIVVERFNEQVAQRAEETLRRMFDEENQAKRKELSKNQDRLLRQFSELANLGAFTSPDYREQAAAKIFGYARITIDPALIEEFRNAATDAERDAVIDKIQQNVADQIPATLWEKITALRYMGMLGSFKTIVSRNVGGNLVFQPVVAAKNVIAAGIESAAISLGAKIEKTRTATYRLADYKAFVDDFGSLTSKQASEVRRLILQGGKYSDNSTPNTFMQGVQEKRAIFGRNDDFFSKSVGRGAEKLRRAITGAMDLGDAVFARQTYAATAARYLKAQGATFRTATTAQLNAARELAIREAAEATYRDNSEFAEAISGILYRDYHGDSKVKLAVRYLGEGIMPFRKTPANIAVRAFEYSPFGLVKSAVDGLTMKYGANRMTGNDLINEFAKGLTGTGLFLLGMFLRRHDWLTGTGPLDDMKKRGFMQLEGWQPYSFKFKIGNRFRYYNADWMSPEAIPLFLGANVADALDEEGLDFWQGAKIAMTVGDPIIKMSMLSGLNDALADAASYGGTEYALMNFIGKAYWSGLTQMVAPQAYLQAARAVNNIRQTTFTDKNSAAPAAIQKAIGGFPYPGNPHRMDYIDMWGRTQENYVTPAGNAAAQILSPSYQSIEDIDTDTRRMENALMALYDRTGETSVLPSAAKSSFDLNGQKKHMTKAEYAAYATRRGHAAQTLMKELTESPAYSRLDDAHRIAAVSSVYDYATQMSKASLWGDADDPQQRFSADSWIAEANDLAEKGIPVADYICAKAIKSKTTPIQDANGDSILTKVVWRKSEGGKVTEKKNEVSSSSIQAALEIRQVLQYSGSDAQKKYKLLFKDLDIAESVWGKGTEYLQNKLDAVQKKGAAP